MNRLSVYSYLTRYSNGHTGSGRVCLAPLPDIKIPVKTSTFYEQAWTNPSTHPPIDPCTDERLNRIWRRLWTSPSQITRTTRTRTMRPRNVYKFKKAPPYGRGLINQLNRVDLTNLWWLNMIPNWPSYDDSLWCNTWLSYDDSVYDTMLQCQGGT